jgi:hypothetical protein
VGPGGLDARDHRAAREGGDSAEDEGGARSRARQQRGDQQSDESQAQHDALANKHDARHGPTTAVLRFWRAHPMEIARHSDDSLLDIPRSGVVAPNENAVPASGVAALAAIARLERRPLAAAPSARGARVKSWRA